jgi:hypothetical protein
VWHDVYFIQVRNNRTKELKMKRLACPYCGQNKVVYNGRVAVYVGENSSAIYHENGTEISPSVDLHCSDWRCKGHDNKIIF